MPIKLIATDLDGTLLNSQWEVSAENLRALVAAAKHGIHLVLVTGRRRHSARALLSQMPCPFTLIASNGALICASSGEIVRRDFLPGAIARQVLAATRPYRPYAVAIYDLEGRGQLVMQENAVPEGPLGWYLKRAPECLLRVPELEDALSGDPVQVMFGGPPPKIDPVEMLLRNSPVAGCVQMMWTKYLTRDISIFDVMNHGCTKGRALALWAERLGIRSSEVMAIGDNYNDLEMLQFAGLPVLMGNAIPGLGQPHWPVTLTNDKNGVAAAIQKYVMNRRHWSG